MCVIDVNMHVSKRIVISCITFETVRIVEPIQIIGHVDRAYILHYSRDGDSDNLYESFYMEVQNQLKEFGVPEVIGCNVKVFRFKDVLRELMRIITKERTDGNQVYVNVSGGSSEYGAASTLASMMVEGTTPFTVSTRDYMVSGEMIKKCYFEDGRPIGISRTVNPPKQLPVFHLEPPPEYLVRSLMVLNEKIERSQLTTYTRVIESLKNGNLWDRRDNENVRDQAQSERMYYARHYLDQWINRGWVKKRERGSIELTEDGKMIIDVFYIDCPPHSIIDMLQ